MAGANMKLRDDGWRVGILEVTNGEPTPHGAAGRSERAGPPPFSWPIDWGTFSAGVKTD